MRVELCVSVRLRGVTDLVNWWVYRELLILVDNFKTGIMNFKPTIRPHHLNPYSQSTYDPYPYRIMIPKKNNQLQDEPSSRLSSLKRVCLRCNSKSAIIQCNQCSKSNLCCNCDQSLHSIGKFQNHRRILLSELLNQSQCNIEGSKLDQVIEKDNIQSEIRISTKISITQTWENIISEVSQKFKQAVDSLKDKKKQIIQKIQRKRDQDIKYFQASTPFYTDTRKCNKKTSLEQIPTSSQINSKFLTLNSEEIEQRIDKKYKTSFTILEEVQLLIDKIDIKNMLVRILEQPQIQTVKKSMKRSLLVSPNGSLCYSPGTKTPVHAKKLSQSTIETDPLEFGYKINIEGKRNLFDPQKQGKMLAKIKSQKVLCKSPINTSKHIKDKATAKKGLKQGQ